MRRFVFLAALVLFIAGCVKDPVLTSKTNNADIEVELLFEHDGCRVYRFHDAGRAIYFVKGGSDVRWNTGKHGNETNSVQTVE